MRLTSERVNRKEQAFNRNSKFCFDKLKKCSNKDLRVFTYREKSGNEVSLLLWKERGFWASSWHFHGAVPCTCGRGRFLPTGTDLRQAAVFFILVGAVVGTGQIRSRKTLKFACPGTCGLLPEVCLQHDENETFAHRASTILQRLCGMKNNIRDSFGLQSVRVHI